MKTPEELAAETQTDLDKEAGGGSPEPEPEAASAGGGAEDDFTDDDLDPAKLEPLLKAAKPTLDSAGLLKRFHKVHGRWKETEAWKKEHEPKWKDAEGRLSSLDTLLDNLYKMRPKDAADKPGIIEDFLDQVMQGKGDLKAFHEAVGKMLNPAAAGGAVQNPPESKALAEIQALKDQMAQEAQKRANAEYAAKVAEEFRNIPKILGAKPEFKALPWKDKAFLSEFEDMVESLALAWATRNEAKERPEKAKPIAEFAEQAAKVYIRGGSMTLQRQTAGKDGSKLGLTRSDNPGGASTRKLPTKGDENAEIDYLKSLAAEVSEEVGA